MGVIVPGYNLEAANDLPHLRRRLKGTGRRDFNSELTLTSLIDVFSVVILFLIQGFSASGEVLLINKDITMPSAQHAKVLFRAPIVTVFSDRVLLEGVDVDSAGPREVLEERNWELPMLSNRLNQYKNTFESIHQGTKFPAEVVIQADKGLDFVHLKRVMYTLTKIGFTNINLAVRGTPAVRQASTNPPSL